MDSVSEQKQQLKNGINAEYQTYNDNKKHLIRKIKYGLLIFSLCFVALQLFAPSYLTKITQSTQTGGGLEKLSTIAGKIKHTDMSAAGLAVVLKFLSGCIFLIGIIVILSVLPIIPIAILLLVSYYLYREQIYALKTM